METVDFGKNILCTPDIWVCGTITHDTMGDDLKEYESVLDLAKNRHCRIVLSVLEEEQRSLTIRDLTNIIIEHDSAVSEEDSQDILISLYHNHCPKLEDMGIVEFNQKRQLIEPTEKFDKVKPLISHILEVDPLVSDGLAAD